MLAGSASLRAARWSHFIDKMEGITGLTRWELDWMNRKLQEGDTKWLQEAMVSKMEEEMREEILLRKVEAAEGTVRG